MTSIAKPFLCAWCIRTNSNEVYRDGALWFACDAFPNGIPARYIIGDAVHVDPVDGDNGLQFEPVADLSDMPADLRKKAGL